MHAWFKKNLRYLLPLVFIAALFFVSTLPLDAIAQTIVEEEPGWFMNTFVMPFLNSVLGAFGLILALGALTLELVINITIVKMRLLIEGGPGGYPGIPAIDLAWRTIRDVANILFVFVLLLISVNIILGSWGSGPYNKALIPKVIIAALLINFSLFFTKVAIDVSNIIAYEFYKTASDIRGDAQPIFGIPTTGLTTAIMNGLQITNIVNEKGKVQESVQGSYPFFSTVLGIITVLVAAFVLMAMALLLLVRFVMFIILMVTSPIAFIGELLPQLKSYSNKWRESLIAQATFAPVFFILILIVITIINSPGFRNGLSAATGGDPHYFAGLVALLVQYSIVIGMLVAALVAAKQTSNKAGEGFVKWGSKWAGKAAFGGTAALGSMTLGRMGRAAAESGTFNRWAAGTGVTGLIGKGLVQGGAGLGKASFDVRATTLGKDLGAGDAAKGYAERRKAAAKAEGEYIKKATVPVRNPNVQAADNKLREIRSRYTQVQRDFEAGKIDIDDRNAAIQTLDIEEATAKRDLRGARIGALTSAVGTSLKGAVRGKGFTEESRARHTLARATRKVRIEGIREIEEKRKEVEKRMKAADKNVKADAINTELKKVLKDAGKQEQYDYLEALTALESVQKQQKDANKDYQREFAGKKQASSFGYMRDAADKVRKDLGESAKDKAWESIKKVLEEAEGGEKKPEEGGSAEKPAESKEPKTS